jgi:DedD protein
MDNRMRDLDQLQEEDPDARKRTLGTALGLAGLVLALLGVGFWSVNHAATSRSKREPDQLHALDVDVVHKVVQPARMPSTTEAEPATTTHTALDTPPEADEERPEVTAALAAADREEAQLAAAETARRAARAARVAAATRDGEAQPVGIPASLSASTAGHELAKTAPQDQLVAAALPKSNTPPSAVGNEGTQGEFALQVISFETPAAADGFARELRGKGHSAYVLPAHVDGRGRYYRVRIGPFKTRTAAEAYRRNFDAREHMNTILVRREE